MTQRPYRRSGPRRPARAARRRHRLRLPDESHLAVLDALHDSTARMVVCRHEAMWHTWRRRSNPDALAAALPDAEFSDSREPELLRRIAEGEPLESLLCLG